MTSAVHWMGGSSGANAGLSFSLPALTSIVPLSSGGSSTPTFTAASTRYQFDFESKANLCLSGEVRFQGARRVRNLISTTSEDFSNAVWQLANSGATAPVKGTTTGTLPNGATGTINTVTFPIVAGGQYSFIYQNTGVAHGTGTFVQEIWLRVASGTATAYLSLQDTGAAPSGSNFGTGSASLTSEWQRFSLQVTYGSGAGNVGYIIGFDTRAGAGQTNSGSLTVQMAYAQLEEVTGQTNQNPSEYVSVGVLSAPYHGANVDGVKYFSTLNGNTVAANVVTEATGAAISSSTLLGYWAEGARADVLGTTAAIRRTMADAGWVAGATMTKSLATGIDGVPSAAACMTGGAVEATNTVLFTTVLASAARTFGVWVRRKTGTGVIRMTDNGGTNWTDITLTTAYQLFQLTRTQANPVVGFQIATNLDAIEIDFNTIEAASFANPTPIPVGVSKAADVLTYPLAGNIADLFGTTYAEVFIPTSLPGNVGIISTGGGQPMNILTSGKTLSAYDGTADRVLSAAITFPNVSVNKLATSWGGVTLTGAVNGTALSATFDGNMGFATSIQVGASSAQPFGGIKNLKIYATQMSASQLQAITT